MAARSISRRSSRYSRSALLLVVAVAIAFLAATYQRTWYQSQVDQVATTIPVDMLAVSSTTDVPPAIAEERAGILEVDGVAEAIPVIQQPIDLRLPNGKGAILALTPELAAEHIDLRSDLAVEPLAAQLRTLADARPPLSIVPLPEDAARLRATIRSDVVAEATGLAPAAPTSAPLELTVHAVVRDAAGLLHRAVGVTTASGGEHEIEIPLDIVSRGEVPVAADAPLELLAIELAADLPSGTVAHGSASVTGLATAPASSGAGGTTAWTAIDGAAATSDWTWAKVLAPRTDPAGTITIDGPPATARLPTERPPVGLDKLTLTIGPKQLAGVVEGGIPALVDPRLAALAAPASDGTIAATQGFADILRLDPVAQVDLVPTLDPARLGAIVDLPTLQLATWARTGDLMPADAWWLPIEPGVTPAAVADGLASSPYGLVTTAIRADAIAARTRDPFQAGVTSILGLVAGAALLFALVGLAVSLWYTVSSRQGEFAVARALGLGRRQLVGWLAIESAFLVTVGVVGGLLVGLVLAWVVMPSITLTTEGRTPVPPPVTAIAWDVIILLAGLGAVAFALSLLAARRVVSGIRVASTLRAAEGDR